MAKFKSYFLLELIVALLSVLIFSLSASCQMVVRTEAKIPDILGYVTLKCDFHIHTVFSDGNVWPDVRVDEAWRQGLDAFAITDHVEYQPHKPDVSANLNRSYEIALSRAKELGLIIIKGSEITRNNHYNAIFLKDSEPLNKSDVKEQVKAAADQNAFIFWNHPPDTWTAEQDEFYNNASLKGIEVINGDYYFAHSHKWAVEKNLTIMCNSDTHEQIGFEYDLQNSHRPMTLVFAKEKSESAIKDALIDHRTVAYTKNMLIGNEKFLKPIFDSSIEVFNPAGTIKNNSWVSLHIRNKSDIPFELVANGKIDEVSAPEKITLYPNKTVIMSVNGQADDIIGTKDIVIPYIVKNLLIATDKSLPVEIKVTVEGGMKASVEKSFYDCVFPATVKLDGNLNNWSGVTWQKVTHDMGWGNAPKDDNDLSFDFACTADDKYLYVAVKVRDDVKCANDDTGDQAYNDDSIEIYIDGDNNKAKQYEPDVSQITIGRYNVGADIAKPKLNSWRGTNGLGKSASETGTMACAVNTDYGWAIEAAIPLNDFWIKLTNGALVGFNIHVNDDDDKGEVDHVIGWSNFELALTNSAYMKPSVFGTLKLISRK